MHGAMIPGTRRGVAAMLDFLNGQYHGGVRLRAYAGMPSRVAWDVRNGSRGGGVVLACV